MMVSVKDNNTTINHAMARLINLAFVYATIHVTLGPLLKRRLPKRKKWLLLVVCELLQRLGSDCVRLLLFPFLITIRR